MMGIMLVFSLPSFAQTQSKNSLLRMIDEDRTTIDVIAGCDRKIQPHILMVSQTPEILIKIEELQSRSQDQFKNIIEGYDRDTQSAFYEMARYPNLITELVSHGRPSDSEVDRIVSNYPQDIREITKSNAVGYFDVLLQIERLNNEIDHAFQNALEPYASQTRESVNVLIGYPEIVSALVNDKPFTAQLGLAYREDPEWVMSRINLISQELAEHNREDLDAYKNQIQKDPQAYNEMLEASERFARERNEVRYLDGYSEPVIETRVVNSYPYWFGYPYWYSDPYWRPLPLYYHTGVYRNQYGNVEIVGLPSSFFLHWHSEYHPRMYPHLSYNYYNFYENHYMKRFHESPSSFPHQGFYRSIENNVINNPRVNNRSLRKIDRQQGNNIVRKPNTFESESRAGGSSGTYSTGRTYGSGQGRNQGGNVAPGTIERQNTGSYGRSGNQRQFNTVNPDRSEGNVNPGRFDTGNSPIRKATREGQVQQYNSRTPVQQNNNTNRTAPVQQNNNRLAPVQQNYNRPAPGQQNYDKPARVQQNYDRQAPVQQNYNRPAPVQQNNNRTAPVQQNNTRVAPAQQSNSNVVREKAPAQSNSNVDHPRREKETRREH